MGQIKAWKCPTCKAIFEDEDKYNSHIKKEEDLQEFNKMYPDENDKPGCNFANGEYCIKRDKEYLDNYKSDLLKLIKKHQKISYEPFTYGWFRTLDDGGSMFYGLACKVPEICPTCYREWEQQYYANHCQHIDNKAN